MSAQRCVVVIESHYAMATLSSFIVEKGCLKEEELGELICDLKEFNARLQTYIPGMMDCKRV